MMSCVPAGRAGVLGVVVAWVARAALAGYEQPVYIDGCRSADGRYEVVAEAKVRASSVHGPHAWEFIWKDTQTGATHRMAAQGIQGG